MIPEKVILNNAGLSAEILLDWGYERSRYDRSATVGQIRLNGHTFVSRESNASGGVGLGGIGLTNVFEWEDTSLYDSVSIADRFPLLGVGLLKRSDMSPFQFTRDYAAEPFEHLYDIGEDHVSVRTLPAYCLGVAADVTKTYTLDGNSLCVDFLVKNVGERDIRAYEFCHNFFMFDNCGINADYRVSFPYSAEPLMRRGEIILGRDYFRPYRFDVPSASSAFWINGWQGMTSHWFRIDNEKLGMSVLVEDEFPPCRLYCWINPDALCPEVFRHIEIRPGEETRYRRRYCFNAGK